MDKNRLSKLNNKLKKFQDVLSVKDNKPSTWQKECQNYKQQQQTETSTGELSNEQKNIELSGYMNELKGDEEQFKQLQVIYEKLLLKHTQLQDEHIRLQYEHVRLQNEYMDYLKAENTKLKNI